MRRPSHAHLTRSILVVAAVLTLAAGCTSGGTPQGCGGASNLLPASPAALPTLDARGFTNLLCQLRGKPVVVNVWASWCGPCIFEAPDLAAAAADYAGQVQFIGVDVQDQLAPGRAFIQKFGWTYPSVFDPKASIRDSFGLIGAPHTLFFDASGVRTFVWSGPVTKEILANGIKEAVRHGEGSSSPSGSAAPTG
jgi:cytochrome c biogenesis protein CcmG, thiol:disulfide interchange protein DsbE